MNCKFGSSFELDRLRAGVCFERGDLKVRLGVDKQLVPARKAHPAFIVADRSALIAKLKAAGIAVSDEEPPATASNCSSPSRTDRCPRLSFKCHTGESYGRCVLRQAQDEGKSLWHKELPSS